MGSRVLFTAFFSAGSLFTNASFAAVSMQVQAPSLQEIAPTTHQMAQVVSRFRADLASIEHVRALNDQDGADGIYAPQRAALLQTFLTSWRKRVEEIDASTMTLEDQIDHALLRRDINYRLDNLNFDKNRREQMQPLLPGVDQLVALAEARRSLNYANPRQTADTLDKTRASLKALADSLSADNKKTKQPSPIVAFRAARQLESIQRALKDWYTFYAGYDPEFTWWNKVPFEALDQQLKASATLYRDTLAGASNPETIVGDPIGRQALFKGLRHEGIAYTPEQLIEFAEEELRWCQAQMEKAASELGVGGWRAALETVKQRHPEPGDQPDLVVKLADEAIDYLVKNELVTVPELAKRDWRMTMLDANYQLQNPFFLGGEDVWVSYPTDTMPHDKKLNSIRGNNRHFSRAVVHHELIPGHHLQHFMTRRFQPHRELFDTPFWTEGWALYWELRLYEMGFAKTPEDRIGMLFWRSHRAARILFSLSFHLEKMTPKQAIDLLINRVGHEPENAAAEVRRSFQSDYGPLYQIAYLVGGWQFRTLNKEMVGPNRMSEREFHDAVMQGGPMPVSFVRARLRKELTNSEPGLDWKFITND